MALGFFIGGEEVKLVESVLDDGEYANVPELRLVFGDKKGNRLQIIARGKVEVERIRRGDIVGRRIANQTQEEPPLDPPM
jgi:hypothetical protein